MRMRLQCREVGVVRCGMLLLLLLQRQVLMLLLLLQLMWLRGRVEGRGGTQIQYGVRRMQVLLRWYPSPVSVRRLIVEGVRPVNVLLLRRQRQRGSRTRKALPFAGRLSGGYRTVAVPVAAGRARG